MMVARDGEGTIVGRMVPMPMAMMILSGGRQSEGRCQDCRACGNLRQLQYSRLHADDLPDSLRQNLGVE
jgi:hypothetical protein